MIFLVFFFFFVKSDHDPLLMARGRGHRPGRKGGVHRLSIGLQRAETGTLRGEYYSGE